MDKFEEAICEHNPLYKEGLQDKYYQGAKWAWQSRQAEIDQLKGLLEKDEYAHSLYYENLNLQTSIDEKDERINQALNFINNWWHPDLDQKLFVEALCRALRGAND